jgi:type I restriction enzyme S subunit
MAQAPGVVTGRYGTIGEVYFINRAFWPLNTALYVRDFKGNSPRFVYYLLRQIEFLQYSDKAAVPGINRNHLHQAPIVLPPRHIQEAFERLLAPLWARQEANDSETATLTVLRDVLLPKLISGNMQVKDTERLVGERA